MIELICQIELKSDAITSSGLGTELIDSLVSRDVDGRPNLRASHVKGLMRACLSDTMVILGYQSTPLVRNLFGSFHDDKEEAEGLITVGDFSTSKQAEVGVLTKTAIDENGVADSGTLRSVEAVAAGTVFLGKLRVRTKPDSPEALAAKLAFLSIEAVGGSRSRGAGECLTSIEAENRDPSEILAALRVFLEKGIEPLSTSREHFPNMVFNKGYQVYRVTFSAEEPVCCPENPAVKNTIISGFSIPASAVQGALLHKLNDADTKVASTCFCSKFFRAWPLQPVPENGQDSLRISLTHKLDKNSETGREDLYFTDEAIVEDWREKYPNAPLKGTDGVLVLTDGKIQIWKSTSMPRVVSVHNAVKSSSTALFSMESMAPLKWTGLISVPTEASALLENTLDENSFVSFGKRRTVQGGGQLTLEKLQHFPLDTIVSDATFFIVQSPILLENVGICSIEEAFSRMVEKWTARHQLPELSQVWVDAGIRFGWNRHGLGETIDQNNRLQAEVVVLPGSVIKLNAYYSNAYNVQQALIEGLGEGRERGYGALRLHPGIARDLYNQKREIREATSEIRKAIQEAVLLESSHKLPSASQLGALLVAYRSVGKHGAMEFLEQQKKRGTRYWSSWQDSYEDLSRLLAVSGADSALQYLVNKSVANRKDEA